MTTISKFLLHLTVIFIVLGLIYEPNVKVRQSIFFWGMVISFVSAWVYEFYDTKKRYSK